MTMPTTKRAMKELIAELNAQRAAMGKQPLKAWKDSRAKLEAALGINANAIREFRANEIAAAQPTPVGEPVKLKDIAAELGINPKVARAKLRRATIPAEYSPTAKHTYPAAARDWLTQLLRRR